MDIVHAELTRSSARFELRVGFGAGVPERQADEDRTMNVASFYDVIGDGQIDYETWVNLADNGWRPGYLDRREGRARFMDDSGVQIGVKSAQLVIRFPLGHLDGAAALWWSVGSEWGSHEVVSTPAAARDHAQTTDPPRFQGEDLGQAGWASAVVASMIDSHRLVLFSVDTGLAQSWRRLCSRTWGFRSGASGLAPEIWLLAVREVRCPTRRQCSGVDTR